LLLGKGNTATKTTTLKNSKGTALSLKSKSTKPPLKVNSRTKVAKLNADQLDGLDSTALQNRPYVITLAGSSGTAGIAFPLTGVPAGTYQVTYNLGATVGGSPTFFGCYLRRATAPTTPFVPQVAVQSGGWYVTGAGVYTVAGGGTDQLYCTTSGTGISVPVPTTTAQLVLTRVDGTAASTSGGVAARGSARSSFGR
jgi:hypothetical protein